MRNDDIAGASESSRNASPIAFGYRHTLPKHTSRYAMYASVKNDACVSVGNNTAAASVVDGADPSVFIVDVCDRF